MKKQNQAPTKNRRAAQNQRKQKQPSRFARNALRRLSKNIFYCYSGSEIDHARAKRGKELGYIETAFGEEQYLCRKRAGQYCVAIESTELYERGEWKRSEGFGEMGSNRLRRVCVILPVTRVDAVKWLADHIIENFIPEEFHRDFNRGERALQTESFDYRLLLQLLLGLDKTATDKQIDAAMRKAVTK